MPTASRTRPSLAKAQRREFSLPQLSEAIARELSRRGLDWPAPSMPTLKAWSAKGLVDATGPLQAQASLACDRMSERYYAKRTRTRPETDRHVLAASSELAAELKAIRASMGDLSRQINNIGKPAGVERGPGPGDPAAGVEAPARLVNAIAQLDAVRLHLMRRHDAELTLLKSAAGPATGQGSISGAEQMRLEGRLNRIEANQARILELLLNLRPGL